MTLMEAIMELSADQIRALENGAALPVTINHTRCVILRTDIYERVQALLDIEDAGLDHGVGHPTPFEPILRLAAAD